MAFKWERVPVTEPTGTKDTEESPISNRRCGTKCGTTAAACQHTGQPESQLAEFNCRTDRGSQVTTITKSFHDTHFSPNLNKTQQDGRVGRVKLQSKNTIVILAGKKMAVDNRARHVPMVHGAPLLGERPTNASLPGGLICCSYIMASPRQTYFKVPILLKNDQGCLCSATH